MKTIKQLEKGCGEWSSYEGSKGHTGGLPSCGEHEMLCDICKIELKAKEEVLDLINKSYADMVALVEHQFPDDIVADKVMDAVEDYTDELKLRLTGDKRNGTTK